MENISTLTSAEGSKNTIKARKDGNIIVPTFDTKVTEYLCWGWVFFLRTNFDFLTSNFYGIFLYHSKGIVVLSLNSKRYFACDHFSYSYEGLKIAILTNLGQLTRDIIRAINA